MIRASTATPASRPVNAPDPAAALSAKVARPVRIRIAGPCPAWSARGNATGAVPPAAAPVPW